MKKIPFNKPFFAGDELEYIEQAVKSGKQSGNNFFGKRVVELMRKRHGFKDVFLTPSCTAALEMGALLADIRPGDEVILPSYTFSSTVNAVLIFGAVPVFCEVTPETMNIDVTKIEELITPKTRMIIPIDYAGYSCDMVEIMELSKKYRIIVMQDCAQSYGSMYQEKPTGTLPHLACFSFHETKNYSSGEGGALVVNVPEWKERASFVQEKGTDRTKVLKGIQNRYSWIDKGSSYLLSDVLAAMLLAQLEAEEFIKEKRELITRAYKNLLDPYQAMGKVSIGKYSSDREINHHAFWVLLDSTANRDRFIDHLEENEVSAYIGYIPLHSSKMGKALGYKKEDLPVTEDLASRIVRLPFYTELPEDGLDYCIQEIERAIRNVCN